MAKKDIEIRITALAGGLQSGLRMAMGIVGDFVNDIKNVGSAGAAAFAALNQAVFFFTQNVRFAIDVAKGLYEIFLSQAVQAERLQVVLEHMTGSQEDAATMMEHLDQVSQNLGLDWETVAMGGQQMAAAAKDAQGNFDMEMWEELLTITQNLSALRPDVPFQLMARGVTAAVAGDMGTLTRLLDVNVNQLLGLQEAADEVLATGGRLSGLVEIEAQQTEDIAQGGIDALRQLQDALGAVGLAQDIAEETIAGSWGRIKAEFEAATREIGEKFLPLITEGLQAILDWWDENEEQVMAIAGALADDLVGAIEGVDWAAVAAGIGDTVQKISDLIAKLLELNAQLANSDVIQFLERTFNPETGTIGAPWDQNMNYNVGRGGEPLIDTIRSDIQSQGQARRERMGITNVSGEWADKTIREVVEEIQLNLLDQLLAPEGG